MAAGGKTSGAERSPSGGNPKQSSHGARITRRGRQRGRRHLAMRASSRQTAMRLPGLAATAHRDIRGLARLPPFLPGKAAGPMYSIGGERAPRRSGRLPGPPPCAQER